MNKKGQEVFQTIVKAVLVLVVLAIVLIILGNKIQWFNQNATTCASKGGKCSETGKCETGEMLLFTEDCEKNNKEKGLGQCCIPQE